jgi:hypothetical protein
VITALPHSRGYSGSFNFYFYLQNADSRTISADLTNTSIDLSSSVASTNVNEATLFNGIKNTAGNTNLDLNAIIFTFKTFIGTYEPWVFSGLNANFGIGNDANQAKSLTL